MKYKSLSHKLLILLLSVGLIFFVIPNYLTSNYLLGLYEEEIHIENMKSLEGAANLLTSELIKIESTVETFKLITQQRFTHDGEFFVPDLHAEEDYYESLFTKYLANEERFSNSLYIYFEPTLDSVETHDVWVQIRDNRIVREKEYDWVGDNPVPSAPWFYEPKERKVGYWVDPYRNRFDRYITSYVTPIYIKEGFVGIFGMYLEMKSLEEALLNISYYANDMFWLLNSEDKVIFHPHQDEGIPYTEFVVSGNISKNGVTTMKTGDGSETKSYYSYVQQLDQNWTFVYSIPEDELDYIHETTMGLLYIIFSVTLVCLVVLVILIVKYYKKVLDDIMNGLKRIRNGDLDTVLERHTNDEIGLLVDAINDSNKSLIMSIAKYRLTENELYEALQKEASANEAKSRFLANMSHELRTPMNGMIGMIQLTLMDNLSAEQKEQLVIAKRSAEVLVNILDDILVFSSLNADTFTLNPSYNNMETVVNDIFALYKPLGDSKGISIGVNFIRELPDQILFDAKRIKQVIANLLGNAVKFTNEGSVDFYVEVLDKSEENVKVRFSCKDTGIGISEQDMGKIFNTFTQVDNSNKRQVGGTGLGLAISKSIIELMDGVIYCESELGVGSEFYFDLDFLYEQELVVDSTVIPQVISDQSPTEKESLKVLVVDDDLVNQKVIAAFLRKEGYICINANNGAEAVELVQTDMPDIILMDISMPVMDGVEAMRNIREKDCQTVIIAQTAFAYEKDRIELIENGFDEYLKKPIEFELLSHMLLDLVNGKYATTEK